MIMIRWTDLIVIFIAVVVLCESISSSSNTQASGNSVKKPRRKKIQREEQEYVRERMWNYKVPGKKDAIERHCRAFLELIDFLNGILERLVEYYHIMETMQHAAVLVDMMDYVRLVTEITKSLSPRSLNSYGQKMKMGTNELVRKYWSDVKLFVGDRCMDMKPDHEKHHHTDLSLPVIRLIIIDTRHRMRERNDIDKQWDRFCAQQLHDRDNGYPDAVYDANEQNLNDLVDLGY